MVQDHVMLINIELNISRHVFQARDLIHGMSVCHSLTIIENELTGDPLDLKMFLSTNWTLKEPKDDTSEQVSRDPLGVSWTYVNHSLHLSSTTFKPHVSCHRRES